MYGHLRWRPRPGRGPSGAAGALWALWGGERPPGGGSAAAAAGSGAEGSRPTPGRGRAAGGYRGRGARRAGRALPCSAGRAGEAVRRASGLLAANVAAGQGGGAGPRSPAPGRAPNLPRGSSGREAPERRAWGSPLPGAPGPAGSGSPCPWPLTEAAVGPEGTRAGPPAVRLRAGQGQTRDPEVVIWTPQLQASI